MAKCNPRFRGSQVQCTFNSVSINQSISPSQSQSHRPRACIRHSSVSPLRSSYVPVSPSILPSSFSFLSSSPASSSVVGGHHRPSSPTPLDQTRRPEQTIIPRIRFLPFGSSDCLFYSRFPRFMLTLGLWLYPRSDSLTTSPGVSSTAPGIPILLLF